MSATDSGATNSKDTFVVFIHGFSGDGTGTWGNFPNFLGGDADLSNCQFRFWDYPTELAKNNLNPISFFKKLFWENDPNISTISQGLRTLLNFEAADFKKIVLFAHSMGGLVVQRFIIEEIRNERADLLDRITEISLFGTPSGGLVKAGLGSWVKNQIADMSVFGAFVKGLRADWTRLIDERRSAPDFPLKFRLTLVAGMKDNFVPQNSSLDPFPLDEKEIVPGNHTQMIKPEAATDLVYLVIKNRLSRGTLTVREWQQINGQSNDAVELISRVRASAEFGFTEELVEIANKQLAVDKPRLPRVDRALGLALLDCEQYQLSATMLARYLEFKLPGGSQPFASDAQAVQQLAIALSGAGDLTGAVARLRQLDEQVQNDSETQGILAGRFKRHRLKNQSSAGIGWQAYNLYKQAFDSAKKEMPLNVDQAFYNGINAAYLSFALGEKDYIALAEEVLTICKSHESPDYWCAASSAEAHLLLGHYEEAENEYRAALKHAPPQRYWTTTGQQALDIIRRKGMPEAAQGTVNLFRDIKADY